MQFSIVINSIVVYLDKFLCSFYLINQEIHFKTMA